MASIPPEQQKYIEEAAKRKRSDGMKQFQELHYSDNDRLRSLADDPWADHETLDGLPRPIDSGGCIKFLIMGAGLGGILSAIRLIQTGFKPTQIVMVEAAGGVGGTWYWNRYPGLHCDVEAYVYMPLLEETGYMPSHKYASSVEIRTYLNQVLQHFDLAKRVLYRTQINSFQWDDSIHAWKTDMTTSRGPGGVAKAPFWINANFVILASGIFPFPQVPKLPGLASFEGDMFHTSRWNYDVTGGSSDTVFPIMNKLTTKRVGIVGTGATSVQVVPELAKHANDLYVFQRTPSQVHSRGQRCTDPVEWQERIAREPGWQEARMENLAEYLSNHVNPGMVNLIDDEWSKLHAYCSVLGSRRFGTITSDKVPEHIAAMQALDADSSAKARKRVSNIVRNKDVAEKLTAWYPTWCKRPTFSDNYLQAFNEPNVHLVDTDGKGIDSITPHGIVANGKEYPIDVLVLSTGYRSPGFGGGDPAARIGIEILGRNGIRMTDKWASQGPTSLHGCCTNGFPNLFWLGFAQASATSNVNHPHTVQSEHISYIISQAHHTLNQLHKTSIKTPIVEPTETAEEAWALKIVQGAAYFSSVAVCTPGYITLEGEVQERMKGADQATMMKGARGAQWSEGIVSFTRYLEKWRDEGKMDGIGVSFV